MLKAWLKRDTGSQVKFLKPYWFYDRVGSWLCTNFGHKFYVLKDANQSTQCTDIICARCDFYPERHI